MSLKRGLQILLFTENLEARSASEDTMGLYAGTSYHLLAYMANVVSESSPIAYLDDIGPCASDIPESKRAKISTPVVYTN